MFLRTVAILHLLLVLSASAYMITRTMEDSSAHQWPSTTGEVLSFEQNHRHNSSNSGHALYEYRVTYSYKVKGRTYTSDRGDLSSTSSDGLFVMAAQDYRETFLGSHESPPVRVRVFYDPLNPERAILNQTELSAIIAADVCMLVWLVMGLVFLVVAFKPRPRREPER